MSNPTKIADYEAAYYRFDPTAHGWVGVERKAYAEATAGRYFCGIERQVIIGALKSASGRIAGRGGAAERLGLKRTTLQNKMYRLNITRADYSVDQELERAPRRARAAYNAHSQEPGPLSSAAEGSSFLWSQYDGRSSDQWKAPNRSKSA